MRDASFVDLPKESAESPGLSAREQAALSRFRPQRSIRRRIAAPIVIAICKLLMERLNTMVHYNREAFETALAQDRPLITYSNHVSLFDDPWITGTFAGWSWDRIRWVAADALNFFDSAISARFFSAGKGVPIVRGGGLDQLGIRFLEDRLREGKWVHIFPEGGRSRDPLELRTPLKPGMAHMIRSTRPLVLAFHHRGMEEVMPIGGRFPRIGKKVSLRFGQVEDSELGLADLDPDAIMRWAEDRLLELQARCQ